MKAGLETLSGEKKRVFNLLKAVTAPLDECVLLTDEDRALLSGGCFSQTRAARAETFSMIKPTIICQ